MFLYRFASPVFGSLEAEGCDTVIMREAAMVEPDTAIKVSVDGKKLFDMSKDLVWDSLQLADNPGTDNICLLYTSPSPRDGW